MPKRTRTLWRRKRMRRKTRMTAVKATRSSENPSASWNSWTFRRPRRAGTFGSMSEGVPRSARCSAVVAVVWLRHSILQAEAQSSAPAAAKYGHHPSSASLSPGHRCRCLVRRCRRRRCRHYCHPRTLCVHRAGCCSLGTRFEMVSSAQHSGRDALCPFDSSTPKQHSLQPRDQPSGRHPLRWSWKGLRGSALSASEPLGWAGAIASCSIGLAPRAPQST